MMSLMSSHPTCTQQQEVSAVRAGHWLLHAVYWRQRATAAHTVLTSAAEVPVGSRLSISSSPGLTTSGAERMSCFASSCNQSRQQQGSKAKQRRQQGTNGNT